MVLSNLGGLAVTTLYKLFLASTVGRNSKKKKGRRVLYWGGEKNLGLGLTYLLCSYPYAEVTR